MDFISLSSSLFLWTLQISRPLSILISIKLYLLLRRVPKIFPCLNWLYFPFQSTFPHRLNLIRVCLLLQILFLVFSRYEILQVLSLLPSKLTGAGLLLLHAHRRLGHLHDRALKRMIDCGMCGNLVWVPGIFIRAHCWDCLKWQQKHNVPAPDSNIRELHQRSCQVLVWDWCGPQHVCALHCELYWLLAVCPRGYHWGTISAKKSDFVSIVNSFLRHISGKLPVTLVIIVIALLNFIAEFCWGFILMLMLVTKTWNKIFVELLALECLLLVLFCLLDHLFRIRCLPPRVKLNTIPILLLSKI